MTDRAEAEKTSAAQSAVRRGQSCFQLADKAGAVRWFERAYRLAPADPSVRLLLASALAGDDDTRCLALLTALLVDYPAFREARIAASAALLRVGQIAAAIGAFGDMLSETAPPDSPQFHELGEALAREGGYSGWAAADSQGRLSIGLGAGVAPAAVRLALDDRPIRPVARRQAQNGVGLAGLYQIDLPKKWASARRLTVHVGSQALLGSPIDLAALRRVQGFVGCGADGALQGWATHPADADAVPVLRVFADERAVPALVLRADDATLTTSSEDDPARIWGFRVARAALPEAAQLRVVGPDGADLLGSPVFVGAERHAAALAASALRRIWPARAAGRRDVPADDGWRPLPTDLVTDGPGRAVPAPAAIDVIIPVYRGLAEFAACWASLRRKPATGSRKRGRDVRFVVIDDASPDPALRAEVAGLAQLGEIVLLRHDRNRGFPSAVNTGMRAAARARRDVVLLNADTLLPVGWLERLANAAYAGGNIGSVTPMTNDGTIMSYPSVARTNPTPDLAATDQLDARMRAANGRGWVEVPTAVGFCMYIRHDCLADVGLFREDAFAQGYGEEVDWCLRARHLGWRHVAATGVFVGHLGGRSFGGGKRHLLARNGAVLNRLHPGYDALIAAFVARDPLADARFRADARAWAERRMAGRAVVLITHADGGGVERFVQERCATLRAGGRRPIVLRPVLNRATASPHDRAAEHCRVSEGDEDAYPNLCFALPADETQLLQFLQEDTPDAIEVHHLLGYSPSILALIRALGLPYQVFIHDYGYWCPRITLCTKGPRYCGEPLDTQVCDACVMDMGRRTGGDLSVVDMRADSARFLAGAVRVVVSCDDVAGRVARHFPGVHPVIIPWENDASLTLADGKPPLPGPPWRVLIVGAIGSDKGYESLLGCVRDAAQRNLPLSFIVAGYTMDDTRLMDSGPVFITGAFEEDEAVSLALAQRAHIGFLPSIWPETWCYALSTLWCAGLNVAAFAFGAPALRISRSGRGVLLPVGLAPGRINDALIQMAIQAHTRTHPSYAHQKAGAETKGSADRRRRTGQKTAASPQIVFSSE